MSSTYLDDYNKGGLEIPTSALNSYTQCAFSIFDHLEQRILEVDVPSKAPVNGILVSAPEIVSSKTRAGGSLSLCHYFIASSYVIYSGCRLYKHP